MQAHVPEDSISSDLHQAAVFATAVIRGLVRSTLSQDLATIPVQGRALLSMLNLMPVSGRVPGLKTVFCI